MVTKGPCVVAGMPIYPILLKPSDGLTKSLLVLIPSTVATRNRLVMEPDPRGQAHVEASCCCH